MIAIGSDHGGFALKQEIMKHLEARGLEYKDFGTYTADSCDYPQYGAAVGRAVASGECERGILICGTGIGISISANKIHGVRCALCSEPVSTALSRQHNDANIVAMGARTIGPVMAEEIVRTFLTTEFEGGRHARRVEKIMQLDRGETLLEN